jgi:hypothetical protein
MNNQNIDRLRKSIEAQVDREMRTPKDFDYLSEKIFEKVHQTVSPTTLKRMWGYLSETATPRLSTLNILSQFTGYDNWDAFCKSESTEEPVEESEEINESIGQESERQTHDSHRWHPKWIVMTLIAVIALATFTWASLRYSSQPSTAYVLKQGDRFPTCMDYLKLFGISDSVKYWGRVLPHHPNIVVWGPEYNHPHWHNYGNKDSMMPTITEHWEPEGADSLLVVMRNRDKYDHERRLNEVRITFMKNLVDTGYVFVGIYRLSLQQSDTINCVWERVAEECDLSNLDYLDELRN